MLTERKARLFSVACSRRVWHLLAETEYRHAVEVAERFTDGHSNETELAVVRATAERLAWHGRDGGWGGPLWDAGWYTSKQGGAFANAQHRDAPAVLALAVTLGRGEEIAGLCLPWAVALDVEPAELTCLLHDLFGPLPFRAKPEVPAAILAWNDGCIPKLAAGIYQERTFSSERMGILADAMEEAGVTDEEMLGHLRCPGQHCRGCWLLDLLMGKE
jgi:hypothetical protein